MQESTTASEQDAPGTSYVYKASLIGAAHQFRSTEEGLSWRIAGRSGTWPYADIAAIRLSYRPVSMQAHRFRADIGRTGGGRISILSTSWQTAALMAPQDNGYRAFMLGLHRRLAKAGSKAELSGGLGTKTYLAAIGLVALVGILLVVLFVRALAIGQFAGALFFV